MANVWVVSCPCGWSRMVPIETSVEERLATRARHDRDAHSIDPKTTEGTE